MDFVWSLLKAAGAGTPGLMGTNLVGLLVMVLLLFVLPSNQPKAAWWARFSHHWRTTAKNQLLALFCMMIVLFLLQLWIVFRPVIQPEQMSASAPMLTAPPMPSNQTNFGGPLRRKGQGTIHAKLPEPEIAASPVPVVSPEEETLTRARKMLENCPGWIVQYQKRYNSEGAPGWFIEEEMPKRKEAEESERESIIAGYTPHHRTPHDVPPKDSVEHFNKQEGITYRLEYASLVDPILGEMLRTYPELPVDNLEAPDIKERCGYLGNVTNLYSNRLHLGSIYPHNSYLPK